VGSNVPWFPFDFPNDPRVQQALRDGRFNRVVQWAWGDERDAQATALYLQHGFKALEQQGPCVLWTR
jgi:hypothetical protein